ncbi:uncharacterized protein FOMMEDRAFT_162783 [Fomitiporia mediterranea MF3/22]|uniref:Uncharacterized protein n=1 Tax=Fomitiporia mediterranea (strain MF3/22) TaxID=694068 RepID=R7SH26_FOMME|nr:uncharacterized protein FOMMEDRAFT_162783 [Fomitiporia mediterranea MF3/22]EJC97602.1 hypothetical protein FOMMEDRAFT_162783 [Fomitiporia mediterranea MF3/22]
MSGTGRANEDLFEYVRMLAAQNNLSLPQSANATNVQAVSTADERVDLLSQSTVPPVLERYQSARAPSRIPQPFASTRTPVPTLQRDVQTSSLGVPTLSPYSNGETVSQAASSQPIRLDTRLVNNNRRLSAERTIPRATPQARRGTRRGDIASRRALFPSLPTANIPRMSDCLESADDGGTCVRITVKVYPSCNAGSQFCLLYHFLRETFNAKLRQFGLVYELLVPHDKLVTEIIETVSLAMTRQHGYTFTHTSGMYQPHETLHLKLLRIHDRALLRGGAVAPMRLKCCPLDPNWSIFDVLSMKSKFAIPDVALENGRFVLFTVAAAEPLKCQRDGITHDCIADRFFRGLLEDQPSESLSDEVPCTCTEIDSNAELDLPAIDSAAGTTDNYVPTAPPSPIQPSQQAPRALRRNPTQLIWTQRTNVTRQAHRLTNNVSFASPENALPTALWSQPWSPAADPDGWTLQLDNFATQVFELAYTHAQSEEPLVEEELLIQGHNMTELAEQLLMLIERCAERGNYYEVLAPARTISIVRLDGSTVTLGRGLELETLFLAMRTYVAREAVWFERLAGDYSSLKLFTTESTAAHVSAERIKKLRVLGALTSLMVIHKIAPDPIGPAVLQIAYNLRDFRSLHSKFVKTWYPEIHADLQEWNTIGASGDPRCCERIFTSYMQSQAATYEGRTQEEHDLLACDMLFRSVLGPRDIRHPEWAAYLEGASLESYGLDFGKVVRAVDGGSDALISMCFASRSVTPENVMKAVEIEVDSSDHAADLDTVARNRGFSSAIAFLRDLLFRFLSGVGIPCADAFHSVSWSFGQALPIDETDFNAKDTRSTLFTRALTGIPCMPPTKEQIEVSFVNNEDRAYWTHRDNLHNGRMSGTRNGPTSETVAAVFAAQGRIRFQTCTKSAVIPLSYLIRLLKQETPAWANADPDSTERRGTQLPFN